MNRDSKTKGGIVGGTGMENTRDRWAITIHMMAAATASFKVMSGTSGGSSFHRELGSQRIDRDENDVNSIIQCIEMKLVNPFDIGRYEEENMPLINNATVTVAHLKFRNLYSVPRSKAKRQWESLSKPG